MKAKNIFNRFDNYVLELVNSRMKTRFFDYLFPRFTKTAGISFLCILIIGVYAFSHNIELKSFAMEAGLAQLVTAVAVHTIKFLAKRVRPYDLLEGLNTFDIVLPDYSFPSGHTAAAFSLGVVTSFYFPALLPMMVLYGLLIAISRMYLAVHYPTDVLVGAIVGVLMTIISSTYFASSLLEFAIKSLNLWINC